MAAASYLGSQAPGAGRGRAAGRPPHQPSLHLDKVTPQTDRCTQSPGCAARVAGAEVPHSPGGDRDPRAPACSKWCCGGGGGAGLAKGPTAEKPLPQVQRQRRETGEERGPSEGAATQPPPPRLSPPTTPPLRRPRPRAAPPPRSAVHTVLFQQNNTTHRPPHPHRAGLRPARHPRARPGSAPRALPPFPPFPPLPPPRSRRRRPPSPGCTRVGRETEPGLGGPAWPRVSTLPASGRSDRRGAHGARGAAALTASAPGRRPHEGGDPGTAVVRGLTGMCTRSDRLFWLGFFLPGLETSFFFLVSMAALPITLTRS